jgi:hypothetical protein
LPGLCIRHTNGKHVTKIKIGASGCTSLQARQKYGSKILTAVDLNVLHSSRGTNFDWRIAKNETADRVADVGFQAAAGENWLLGEC